MRYFYRLNKRKLFNCCFVYDEDDNLLYTVKSDFISFGMKERYLDQNGVEIGFIKKSYAIGCLCDFFMDGIKIAELVRIGKFFGAPTCKLTNFDWDVEWNFFKNKCYVKDNNGNSVMEVYFKILELPNIIEVVVYDDKNTFMCLMCANALCMISKFMYD